MTPRQRTSHFQNMALAIISLRAQKLGNNWYDPYAGTVEDQLAPTFHDLLLEAALHSDRFRDKIWCS